MSAIASKYFTRLRKYPTFLTYCLWSLLGAFLVFVYVTHFVDMQWIIFFPLAGLIIIGCVYYPPATVIIILAEFPLQQIAGSVNHTFFLRYLILALMLFNVGFVSHWKMGSYNKKIILVFIVFLFFVVQSEWWNINANFVNYVNRYTLFVLFILAALQIKKLKDQKVILWSLAALGTILSIWCIFQGANSIHSTLIRSYDGNVLLDRNYASFWIGLGIVFLFAHLINHSTTLDYRKIFVLVLLIINMFAIISLASRGVSIALLFTIIVMLIFRFRNPLKILIIISFFIILFSQIYALPVFDPMRVRFEENSTADAGGRIPIALSGIDYLENAGIRALFFGSGTNSANYTMGDLRKSGGIINPHNTFLEIAMDYGIIGLCTLLVLITLLLRQNLLRVGIVGQAYTGILIFIVICGLSINPLSIITGWILLGIMLPNYSDSFL